MAQNYLREIDKIVEDTQKQIPVRMMGVKGLIIIELPDGSLFFGKQLDG